MRKMSYQLSTISEESIVFIHFYVGQCFVGLPVTRMYGR